VRLHHVPQSMATPGNVTSDSRMIHSSHADDIIIVHVLLGVRHLFGQPVRGQRESCCLFFSHGRSSTLRLSSSLSLEEGIGPQGGQISFRLFTCLSLLVLQLFQSQFVPLA